MAASGHYSVALFIMYGLAPSGPPVAAALSSEVAIIANYLTGHGDPDGLSGADRRR